MAVTIEDLYRSYGVLADSGPEALSQVSLPILSPENSSRTGGLRGSGPGVQSVEPAEMKQIQRHAKLTVASIHSTAEYGS